MSMAEGRDFGRECISHLAHSGPNLTDTTHSLHGEHVSQKPLIHHIICHNSPLWNKTDETREVPGVCVSRVAQEAGVRPTGPRQPLRATPAPGPRRPPGRASPPELLQPSGPRQPPGTARSPARGRALRGFSVPATRALTADHR